MHIGDQIRAMFGQYLDILSSLVTITLQILTLISCVTHVVMIFVICVKIHQLMLIKWSLYTAPVYLNFDHSM
jgi:hypothetical protein